MYEAVIFDWDGTLADTLPVVVSVFQKVLRDIGCQVSDEFLVKRIGIGARNMFRDALRSNGILFNETTIDELMEKKTKIQIKILDQIQLFSGATELLEMLRPKLKLSLATMSNRNIIDRMLKIKGLTGYFDYIITADEVSKPKPDPEVFLTCASKIGCPPEKCLVIEDSIFGIVAAKKANMSCIAIPSGAYSKDDLKKEKPDLIVNSLAEKERILDFIFSDSKL